jgi:hypothetical protein
LNIPLLILTRIIGAVTHSLLFCHLIFILFNLLLADYLLLLYWFKAFFPFSACLFAQILL